MAMILSTRCTLSVDGLPEITAGVPTSVPDDRVEEVLRFAGVQLVGALPEGIPAPAAEPTNDLPASAWENQPEVHSEPDETV